mmetsp:Transcript_15652/g.21193  ORF Transcript_15652/g.21193 Transcript_15652/m.21193 type:complete len:100 (+) Transcript_15652:126-425(+)
MRKLGLNPTQDELDDIIRDIDKDMDGEIDYNEFLRLMSTKLKDAQTREELQEAFMVFDVQNKKQFGSRELTEVSQMLRCNFTREDIQEMIAVADLNGDQ